MAIRDLPFLRAICWQIPQVNALSPADMLRCYERGWHYRGVLGNLSDEEQQFVNALSEQYGSWLGSDRMQHPQHQQILSILSCLNRDFFNECGLYFGGGTLLALKYGEYRLSKDIDFLCSSPQGYRQLRQAVFNQQYQALFSHQDQLQLPREIQANQYGIRFPITIDNQTIRFEIISEGRIELGDPEQLDWCPVASLNPIDIAAEKLLANSDRWNDKSVLSRDLIDLALLRYHNALSPEAIAKAEAAYPVLEPLRRSLHWFREQPDYQTHCYSLLQIQTPEPIRNGLDLLAETLSSL